MADSKALAPESSSRRHGHTYSYIVRLRSGDNSGRDSFTIQEFQSLLGEQLAARSIKCTSVVY